MIILFSKICCWGWKDQLNMLELKVSAYKTKYWHQLVHIESRVPNSQDFKQIYIRTSACNILRASFMLKAHFGITLPWCYLIRVIIHWINHRSSFTWLLPSFRGSLHGKPPLPCPPVAAWSQTFWNSVKDAVLWDMWHYWLRKAGNFSVSAFHVVSQSMSVTLTLTQHDLTDCMWVKLLKTGHLFCKILIQSMLSTAWIRNPRINRAFITCVQSCFIPQWTNQLCPTNSPPAP